MQDQSPQVAPRTQGCKEVQTADIRTLATLISVTGYLGHARDCGMTTSDAIMKLLQSEQAIRMLAHGDGKAALQQCLDQQPA